MSDSGWQPRPVSEGSVEERTGRPALIGAAWRLVQANEIVRYIINGLTSTAVHFLVLLAGIYVLDIGTIGAANFIAAIVGSSCSFLGNRYFVFRGSQRSVGAHLSAFAILYLAAAVFHGAFLYLWSDLFGWHYAIGFLIATGIQTVLVYICNRTMVFK